MNRALADAWQMRENLDWRNGLIQQLRTWKDNAA